MNREEIVTKIKYAINSIDNSNCDGRAADELREVLAGLDKVIILPRTEVGPRPQPQSNPLLARTEEERRVAYFDSSSGLVKAKVRKSSKGGWFLTFNQETKVWEMTVDEGGKEVEIEKFTVFIREDGYYHIKRVTNWPHDELPDRVTYGESSVGDWIFEHVANLEDETLQFTFEGAIRFLDRYLYEIT